MPAIRSSGVANGTALSDAFKREEHDIKLFVLEANLPKRSAISFLHDVRAKGVTIPAIVISQDVEEEIDFQLDERTVMLPKPFQIAELGAVVREVLGSKSDSLEPTQRG